MDHNDGPKLNSDISQGGLVQGSKQVIVRSRQGGKGKWKEEVLDSRFCGIKSTPGRLLATIH